MDDELFRKDKNLQIEIKKINKNENKVYIKSKYISNEYKKHNNYMIWNFIYSNGNLYIFIYIVKKFNKKDKFYIKVKNYNLKYHVNYLVIKGLIDDIKENFHLDKRVC